MSNEVDGWARPNLNPEELVEQVMCVKCQACSKLHDINANTFFSFYGNVMVGMEGGIIGNNFDKQGKLKRVTIYCRSKKCLESVLLQHLIPEPSTIPYVPMMPSD